MLVNTAKIYFSGALLAIVGDTITVPVITFDSSLRASNSVPQGNTLQDEMLTQVNGRIPDALDLVGVEVSASGSIVGVEVDLNGGRSHKDDNDDSLNVWNAIVSKATNYVNYQHMDENGRNSFNSISLDEDSDYIEFVGDIIFNQDGKPVLLAQSANYQGKTLDMTQPL